MVDKVAGITTAAIKVNKKAAMLILRKLLLVQNLVKTSQVPNHLQQLLPK